ncbi:hypothetical protein [Nafulsella turpanensis]|uniref:hypothetical protein n=1 Tax=Nafulsella turpanensis TaxID=1265690 RepID=UPI00034BA4EF|nr:hypothetical protein [Nafulsella turpanensis]
MKSLHVYVFLFGSALFSCFSVNAQTGVQEKVERYLYTSYDINKTTLKEGERVLQIMEEKLDAFLFSMDKATAATMKVKEKEFDAFLRQVDGIKDVKRMEQLVEDSRRSYKSLIANVLEKGVKTAGEAQDCRKAIVFKMMEMDLLRVKQEKLVLLLKDEQLRGKFISGMVSKGYLNEQTDVRSMMAAVDKSVSEYEI